MRMRKKKWALPYIEAHPEIILTMNGTTPYPIDKSGFNRLHLEIGCGKGDFIVGLALKNEDDLCVAVEKDSNAAAVAAKKVEEAQLDNVKILCGDGAYLSDWIIEGSVDCIYLNHSDPWPKKCHEKRRLTYASFCQSYVKWLTQAGQLIQKTDNSGLFEYSLVSLTHHGFTLEKVWVNYPYQGDEDDVATEYEMKFRNLNQPIYRAIFMVNNE